MGAPRVVFDTNVLISGLGFGGTPLKAVLRAFGDDVTIVASEDTLDELERVMRYDRLPIADGERVEFLTILRREVRIVEPTESVDVIERDPSDNAFLECADAADADFLVSGDDDLLSLDQFGETEILSPAAFVERLD